MSVNTQINEKPIRAFSVDGIDKYIRLIANALVWVSMIGFAAMTIVTVVDVIGSKFFHYPFPGGFEITSLIAVVMIVFALPYTQSKKGHIEVELLVERFPMRVQIVIASIMCLISSGLFALATWQMFKKAAGLLSDGNTTAVLFIPIFPFAFASTLCFFFLFLLILFELIKLIGKVARNG